MSCERVESVPVSIWNGERPDLAVPLWVQDLIQQISKRARLPAPTIRVMRVRCPDTFGGRWFDTVCGNRRCFKHAIGIIMHRSHSITKATVCHEMAHYISRMRNGDKKGHHDDRFFDIVEQVYAAFGVSIATAKTIENGMHPEDWEDARGWTSVLRRAGRACGRTR